MINRSRLRALAEACELHLTDEMLAKLDTYATLLVEWNQKFNLTAITKAEEIEIKHFLDSLLLANLPQIKGSLADVGSGAGFPGLVAKIYSPSLAVTLFEPTGKRGTFLKEAAATLGLAVAVEKERAEEAARKKWRGQFDVVTARAVAGLPVLCEYCLPLVKDGGCFIAMKGDDEGEVKAAQYAIKELGGKLEAVQKHTLPDGSARSFVIVQKVGETKAKYPRNGGTIAKRPLMQ